MLNGFLLVLRCLPSALFTSVVQLVKRLDQSVLRLEDQVLPVQPNLTKIEKKILYPACLFPSTKTKRGNREKMGARTKYVLKKVISFLAIPFSLEIQI